VNGVLTQVAGRLRTGDLVTGIVTSGTTVYRVQTMRRTREQAFLELITPGRTPPPFTAAYSTPPP